MKFHTIPLDPLGLENEWVKVPASRSFGMRTEIDDAIALGARAFNVTRANLYIVEWSFPDEITEARLLATEDDVISYVLTEAEAHYQEARRSPAERKSDAGAVSEGAGAPGLLVGDGLGGGGDTAATDPRGDRA